MDRAAFNEIIRLLRSDDPMTYEDGYHSLTGRVDEVLNWLIDLEAKESDGHMKSRFIELIGESTDPQAIKTLKAALSSPVNEVRSWAYSSFCYSESAEYKQIAEEFRKSNPNEEFL